MARWYERFFGQLAASHLCVSTAMQQFLKAEWGIAATVFRDTPPHWFHRTSVPERHELFTRIAALLNGPERLDHTGYCPHTQHHVDPEQDRNQQASRVSYPGQNNFTHLVCQQPQLRRDRPALIVSSTSWTVDEDFQIMLDAAVHYGEVSIKPMFVLCTILILSTVRLQQVLQRLTSSLPCIHMPLDLTCTSLAC